MQKTCAQCSASFQISDADLAAIEKVSPTVGGTKLTIPPPTFCPECRQQRRFTFRNDRNYYRNTCTLCSKSLISSYSPDKEIQVLCEECFWGDNWDPVEHGREFDFSRPFFEQFAEMRKKVPKLAIYQTQSENAEFTIHSSRNRNCYMGSSLVDDEDVHYSDFTFESKSSLDLFSCIRMELCYECSFSEDCFQSDFLTFCGSLTDSLLCEDCRNSQYLIGCMGLRNASNKILNEPASKEECIKTRDRFYADPAFRKEFEQKFVELKLGQPHRASWIINSEEASGNCIWNSKGVHYAFNVKHIEDGRYIYECANDADCYDATRCASCEAIYDCGHLVELRYGAFSFLTYQCDNMLYSENCLGASTCFGCVSLKKHKFCILNKQYTQTEYEELVPKIAEHMKHGNEWGEFFPSTLSPYGYNETKADEWYPLKEDEVRARGWNWSEYEAPLPEVTKKIDADQLPPAIKDIPDDILNWAIVCEASRKPFKIIPQELAFYRTRNIPIPHRSPKQRHYDRIGPHNFRTLYERKCGNCEKSIQTTYPPERPEKVFCEDCYLKEVY